MNEDPTITWLMPVLNGMPYLPQTLASIEVQTYRRHTLLVWDNGSTDGTVAELRRWIPSRLRGHIITERPMGLGASLAALVEAAQTEFCARMDADDVSAPTRLEKQMAYLQAHPEAVAVGTQVDFIDDQGNLMKDPWIFPTDDAEVRWGTRWRPLNLHPTLLLRRSKVLEAGNYRDCKPMEDHDILIRLSLIGKMPNLPDRLYQWRRHLRSITTQIPDHHDYHRECARMNADILFPGVPADQAMRLWDLLYHADRPELAGLPDLRLLNRAATSLAEALGQEKDYFMNSRFFLEQRYHLRQRFAHRMGLKPLLLLKRRMQAAFAGKR
jgi:glycosyltransferase involved in cell wall biosynthesis